MRCPDCDVYFELDAKPSVNFATAVGAVTGAVLRRGLRGAALGGLVGWGVAKMMHKDSKCPRCVDIDSSHRAESVDAEPAEA
jgi:hypothetical protein